MVMKGESPWEILTSEEITPTQEFCLPFVVRDVWYILNLKSQNMCIMWATLLLLWGSTFNKRMPGLEQILHVECLHGTNGLARGCNRFHPLGHLQFWKSAYKSYPHSSCQPYNTKINQNLYRIESWANVFAKPPLSFISLKATSCSWTISSRTLWKMRKLLGFL